MKEIDSTAMQPEIHELLSFATSRASEEYTNYIHSLHRKLFAYNVKGTIAGCIGIEFLAENRCEIKHIAVFPDRRGQKIGANMIECVCGKYGLSSIVAETDQDAVGFYRNIGFEATGLGEKYPGRERFLCSKKIQKSC